MKNLVKDLKILRFRGIGHFFEELTISEYIMYIKEESVRGQIEIGKMNRPLQNRHFYPSKRYIAVMQWHFI